MILYVDETENEEYFIVTGLYVESKEKTDLAYKQFKNRIKGFKIGQKAKSKLFTEFKSNKMDTTYQRLKGRMLEAILELEGSIIYASYKKKEAKLNQVLKQSIYITLLSKIVASLNEKTEIIFDGFGIESFENDIINSVQVYPHVEHAKAADSQNEAGLQFVDNLCSVVRRHISADEKDYFFDMIAYKVKGV